MPCFGDIYHKVYLPGRKLFGATSSLTRGWASTIYGEHGGSDCSEITGGDLQWEGIEFMNGWVGSEWNHHRVKLLKR